MAICKLKSNLFFSFTSPANLKQSLSTGQQSSSNANPAEFMRPNLITEAISQFVSVSPPPPSYSRDLARNGYVVATVGRDDLPT